MVWAMRMLTAACDRSKRQMSEKCTNKVASWLQSVPNTGVIDPALSKQIAGTALTDQRNGKWAIRKWVGSWKCVGDRRWGSEHSPASVTAVLDGEELNAQSTLVSSIQSGPVAVNSRQIRVQYSLACRSGLRNSKDTSEKIYSTCSWVMYWWQRQWLLILPTDGETAPKHCNICNEEMCWLLVMLCWSFVMCIMVSRVRAPGLKEYTRSVS